MPAIDAPHQTDYLFVGDGVRECHVPATNQTFPVEAGELCNPVALDLRGDPLSLVGPLIGPFLDGVRSGGGLASGFLQDDDIEVHNLSIPGAQMIEYAFGTGPLFSHLQDATVNPDAPLRPFQCLGEPVLRHIARLEPPADLVIGSDWFFDSVLFERPPLRDLVHQLTYAMLVLANGEYYSGEPCPAGTSDGTYRVPLVSTDGELRRTFQPLEGGPEECSAELSCPAFAGGGSAAAGAGFDRGPRPASLLVPAKKGYVVDWIALGLVDPSADVNGNGFIDILPLEPEANELTPELLAVLLAASDPSDDPTAVALSTMPWPEMSPAASGGRPGGDGDQLADAVNAELRGLFSLFDAAFELAGRRPNLVLVDVVPTLRALLSGERPDLTLGLDGDYSTRDLYVEYELAPDGTPLERGGLKYGGVFSMDHLHLSATTNAFFANETIAALNEQLGLTIPAADLAEEWARDPHNPNRYDASVRCTFLGEDC